MPDLALLKDMGSAGAVICVVVLFLRAMTKLTGEFREDTRAMSVEVAERGEREIAVLVRLAEAMQAHTDAVRSLSLEVSRAYINPARRLIKPTPTPTPIPPAPQPPAGGDPAL